MIDVAVLVSVGCHPRSGRSRRASTDARALELALSLRRRSACVRLNVVHAGAPDEPALREYLGMGIEQITVLEPAPGTDPVSVLVSHLRTMSPGIVLTGARAERGPCTGFVPYAVADALGRVIVPAIVSMTLAENQVYMLQARPRGQRRRLNCPLPMVITVDEAAAEPCQSAFARAKRGGIAVEALTGRPEAAAGWVESPARRRARRLLTSHGETAAERLRAATEMKTGRGRQLVHPGAAAAAEAIRDYLVEERIYAAARGLPKVTAAGVRD